MIDEQYKALSGLIYASIELLVQKGVFTDEEFQDQLVKSNQQLDQMFQEVKENQRKEFYDKYPGASKLLGMMFDDNLGVKL